MIEFEAFCGMNGGQRDELRSRWPFALSSQLAVIDAALVKRFLGVIEPTTSFRLAGLQQFPQRQELVSSHPACS